MSALPPALAQWVRMPGPSLVLQALRQRAQRRHRTDAGALRLTLTDQQRREVARLLGTPWEVSGRPVSLVLLGTRLAEHGLTARELVEVIDGRPIVAHRDARAQALAVMLAERAQAVALLCASGVPEASAQAWSVDPAVAAPGVVALAERVALVWQRLPERQSQPVRLAHLAADVLHDAHALDADQLTGRAVARVAAIVHALERPGRSGPTWRAAWRAVGVLCDAVSSRVLVLNLPLRGGSPAAAVCAAAPGEPVWLTQRLLAGSWSCAAGTVFVCENPTVVEAAADALGVACPPLVCTDGVASGAAMDLFAGLVAAGCSIMVRADFDEWGLTVVDQVRSVAPAARLWRYDMTTYRRYLGASTMDNVDGEDSGSASAALRAAFRREGRAVHEEQLMELLLEDLRRYGTGSGPGGQM